ncbi:MAG TPA: LysR substrate-binding domain-containing protein [Beijerinckiaceae bacterium]|nr:LysR substrate-binding domain-containing protein [Beijerinckiaceae bacterium]
MSVAGLRAFHLVAQAGSFTKAARAGRVSQPTLSAQVRGLEEAHGVRLFDRRGRGVALTPLGQSLYAVTARLFTAEDEAMDLLAGARTLGRGHLRVAADSASHVMPLLAELKRRHGGLTFSLRIGNSSDVLAQVLDYAADVAVTALQTSDPRIHSLRLRPDRLVVFVPVDHPLAGRAGIPIGALKGADLVIRERGSITREVFESRLAEAGVRPGALVEVQSREAVREAVAAGFGIGIIFESEFGRDPAFAKLDVTGADLAVAEYVVCLEERRRIPLVRGFLDAVRATAGG